MVRYGVGGLGGPGGEDAEEAIMVVEGKASSTSGNSV